MSAAAHGGLVAGGVLGSAARSAQKAVHGDFIARNELVSEQTFRIPLPSNMYVAKAQQGLVHVPRAAFGKVAGMAFDTTTPIKH